MQELSLQKHKICSAVIIGKNRIQSSMLSNFLITEVGIPCSHSNIQCTEYVADEMLFLIDCTSYSKPTIHDFIKRKSKLPTVSPIALLNTPYEQEFETLSHWPNVKGIFYEDVSREILSQGVLEILDDGLWLPRQLTHTLLEYYRRPVTESQNIARVNLTEREQVVLKKLIDGLSNDDIAEVLHVSNHTVKTHLYKAYKKIGVNSRLQAANWAKEYLGE